MAPTMQRRQFLVHHLMLARDEAPNRTTEAALALWTDVVQGRQAGDGGAALRFMADALASVEDASLVRRFADCMLEADPEQGARVFIARSAAGALAADEACTFLKRYPAALTLYLEDRVLHKHEQSERLSTQLAGLYLDRAAQSRQLGGDEVLDIVVRRGSTRRRWS
ncbi:transforming growth factor-beta receptor-associated protein 1-like [Pollicipes pollicipes]|uniref:transforming growth factor-beta receptor-associated protein 1-like n=1 Tax=Pollicipes pollicipes TaxID=41117 RepID=UPI001884E835|nr:transforming growth factor-beta receptor-associated protein 1-like [Pollicipes pollicipes]